MQEGFGLLDHAGTYSQILSYNQGAEYGPHTDCAKERDEVLMEGGKARQGRAPPQHGHGCTPPALPPAWAWVHPQLQGCDCAWEWHRDHGPNWTPM